MARSTRVVNMSVDERLYEDVDRLAKAARTSRSQVLREALTRYIAAERRWAGLLAAGEERARLQGVQSEGDVERIVHEYRAERR